MELSLRVILVEDNPSDAELIVRRLSNDGYHMDWLRVDDEEAYLVALERGCDLILSDWTLPDFSGLRALKIVQDRALDIPFVIVSGSIGEEAAVQSLHNGAADYILKDRPERLGQAIWRALEQKRMRDENREAERLLRLQATALNAAANAIVITRNDGKIEWGNPAFAALTGYQLEEAIGENIQELSNTNIIDGKSDREMWDTIRAGKVWRGERMSQRKNGEIYFEEQTITPVANPDGLESKYIFIKQDISERRRSEQMLQEASEKLKTAYDATLEGWSNALDLREHETAGHSQRVVHATLQLALALEIGEEEIVHVQRGSLLHDIGKMGIPDNILLKPGPLSTEEWEIMRKHPMYAYNMLAPILFLNPALDIPLYHHERWDGKGYPQGLKGEEIPLAARIFAVVDVWDALLHDRPYRKAWTSETTIDYIQKQAGEQFDPHIVEVFIQLIENSPTFFSI